MTTPEQVRTFISLDKRTGEPIYHRIARDPATGLTLETKTPLSQLVEEKHDNG